MDEIAYDHGKGLVAYNYNTKHDGMPFLEFPNACMWCIQTNDFNQNILDPGSPVLECFEENISMLYVKGFVK